MGTPIRPFQKTSKKVQYPLLDKQKNTNHSITLKVRVYTTITSLNN